MLNVIFDPILTGTKRKNTFFTLFILSRASDNTTSLNIGGTNAWAVPSPQIFGGPSPSPPRYPPMPLALDLKVWRLQLGIKECLHTNK